MRSKQNSKYWNHRLKTLFKLEPSMKKVKNKYRTLLILLQRNYKPIVKSVSPDTMQEFLKDVIYLDRKIRWMTEGEEKELKKTLSQQTQVELGYEADYKQNVAKLKTL